jgi:hypothetical protein
MHVNASTSQVPSTQILQAEAVGEVAERVLAVNQLCEAMGVTSRGIFLKTTGRWVLFVSRERFRSPLTINVTSGGAWLGEVAVGQHVHIENKQLVFSETNLCISTSSNTTRQHRLHPDAPPSVNERTKRLAWAAKSIRAKKGDIDLVPVLAWIANQGKSSAPESVPPEFGQMAAFIKGKAFPHPTQLAETLIEMLGRGDGLTPSGDDFVLGFLLARHYLGTARRPVAGFENLNQAVIAAAYQKTTSISANLIECACQGACDERVLAALDYLLGASMDGDEVVDDLLSWGNSSGVAALAGMAAVLNWRREPLHEPTAKES